MAQRHPSLTRLNPAAYNPPGANLPAEITCVSLEGENEVSSDLKVTVSYNQLARMDDGPLVFAFVFAPTVLRSSCRSKANRELLRFTPPAQATGPSEHREFSVTLSSKNGNTSLMNLQDLYSHDRDHLEMVGSRAEVHTTLRTEVFYKGVHISAATVRTPIIFRRIEGRVIRVVDGRC